MKVINFKNQGFEQKVREAIDVYDRPITEDDLLKITRFDITDVDWIPPKDINSLSLFKNLKELNMETGTESMSFLNPLKQLEDLYIAAVMPGNRFDFSVFRPLKNLNSLFVSGGFYSYMTLENVETLTMLENLEELSFHEFGTVDLKFLEEMPKLKHFFCGYAEDVYNIDSIGKVKGLESLELVGLKMDNIDFFDSLDDSVELDLCGLEIREQVDLSKFDRFKTKEIEEIDIYGVGRVL